MYSPTQTPLLKNVDLFLSLRFTCLPPDLSNVLVLRLYGPINTILAALSKLTKVISTNAFHWFSVSGKRLDTTVLRHLNALSEFDCAAHCYNNSCCRSANFKKIRSKDGRENCELLHAVEAEEPENLQENETYDYLTMVQPQRVIIKLHKICFFRTSRFH